MATRAGSVGGEGREGSMNGPLDLAVAFAKTGVLGPLRCGATRSEVEQLLGPPHDEQKVRRPRRWVPRLYFWDDLEVAICHDLVVQIILPMWRDAVTVPAVLGGHGAPAPAHLPHPVVLAALDIAGCAWAPEPEVESKATECAIRTTPADVQMTFWTGSQQALHLYKVIKTDFSVDDNDQQPGQGRLAMGSER
jgi:hypothetical protein